MSIIRLQSRIPNLRAQGTRIPRKCTPCQKFNALPYKYPLQGDLPKPRVQRSRLFAHVGLDYFGPLAITNPYESEEKGYGFIVTCMATRLIHLDAMPDLSTMAFLRMLRRFFGTKRHS
ncbi:hypothetical protein GCK32_022881 [Trichostrongylus colubriformis]|uniref:Uncharacterized protein n=1 Tax=Trichostrongylus colubriformis TaxID=6319 RepID=A0AAN8FU09_TRICO